MSLAAEPRGRRQPPLGRTLLALAAGLVAGILAATAFELFRPTLPAMPLVQKIGFSLIFGLVRGSMVIAICAPCWLLLRRVGRNAWFDAMLLGFAGAFAIEFLLSIRLAGVDQGRLAIASAGFAVAGAIGGLTAWCVGYLRPGGQGSSRASSQAPS